MVLTELQKDICRLVAIQRVASGESFLPGGATFNELLAAPRVSRDLDLFHDTAEALDSSWQADRHLLAERGFQVSVVRERPSFVEAEVERAGETVLMQWTRDSAFRFFPLVEHEALGLVLHPFDLATNKVLALVGRLEVRDWVDVIECDRRLQPLGYLAWAAAGKDPGFSPAAILEQAARSSHYTADEVAALAFAGERPDARSLAREWRRMLAVAAEVVAALPADEAGRCVLGEDHLLFKGGVSDIRAALARGAVHFHRGCIRGALPTPFGPPPDPVAP